MTIILTPEESEEYFYNALCNTNGNPLAGYGGYLDYDKDHYERAKALLTKRKANTCWEDVLMELLRTDGKLTWVDEEGGGDMTRSITLVDIHQRVSQTPLNFLSDMINENDDYETADVILQTVFFEEIIFG